MNKKEMKRIVSLKASGVSDEVCLAALLSIATSRGQTSTETARDILDYMEFTGAHRIVPIDIEKT